MLTPGAVVLTREVAAGPTAAELAARLANLENLTTTNREAARQDLQSVSSILHQQTAERLAEVKAQTKATLAQNQQDMLRFKQQISATTLTPAQVQAMATQTAAQTLAEAAPQFEALALNMLKQSEGYVRTVARQAITDNDPTIQNALGTAVAQALSQEHSPAAFSMRRAIVNELSAAAQGQVSGTQSTTRLGDDLAAIDPAAGPNDDNTVAIDAARLRLGRLLNPGVAPADNPTQMATLTPNHDPREALNSLGRAKNRTDLMNLRDYKVVLHADSQTLPAILEQIMQRAEPFTGKWHVSWRLKPENEDVLTERFSLDAETTFDEFVSYLAQYLLNDRGVKLTFSLFDRERIVLVSD
jgi:hypothetical protein